MLTKKKLAGIIMCVSLLCFACGTALVLCTTNLNNQNSNNIVAATQVNGKLGYNSSYNYGYEVASVTYSGLTVNLRFAGTDLALFAKDNSETGSAAGLKAFVFDVIFSIKGTWAIDLKYADGSSLSEVLYNSDKQFQSYPDRISFEKLSTPIYGDAATYQYKLHFQLFALPDITGTIDVYFKINLSSYTFKYGSNNYDYGTVTSSKGNATSSDRTITVTSNSSFTLNAVAKTGYEFKYWATSKTSTSSISTSATVTISGWPPSNLTYYAIFEEKAQEESTISFTLYPNRYNTGSSSTFKVVIPINGEIVAIGIDDSRYELSAGGSKTSSSITYAANNSGNQLTISFKPSNYGSSSYYDIVIYYYKSS